MAIVWRHGEVHIFVNNAKGPTFLEGKPFDAARGITFPASIRAVLPMLVRYSDHLFITATSVRVRTALVQPG